MANGPQVSQSSGQTRTMHTWTAPLVIVLVVAAVVLIGRKHEEVKENPIVDIAILTVGVFAFAAVFRWFGNKTNAPGLATFFGAPASNTSTAAC